MNQRPGRSVFDVIDDYRELFETARGRNELQAPETLAAYQRFVEREADLLSHAPDSFLLLAYSTPQDNPVRKRVVRDAFVPSGQWLRWLNPPESDPTPALLRQHRLHEGVVNQVAVTPDGRRAVSGGRDGKVICWDLESGRPQILEAHTKSVSRVAVTPDGRRAVSGGRDGKVICWDLESGRPLILEAHTKSVSSVAVTPNGRRAVSGGPDGSDFQRGIAWTL
ncbi:MAG: hypothetical protein O3C40_17395 [Planctomycetota bacterium]|nr:hypothetical protein [Planctomycetota bacterium]